jgi:phosphoribosylanthranilate isomerase
MPTRVKVCGITRLEDAQLAVELGAAALGFNFYAPSPRHLAPAAARDIIRRLPPFVTAVGVFADETDAAHINAVADEAGVGIVQLHGPKFPADDAMGRYPVIRTLSIAQGMVPTGWLEERPWKEVEDLPIEFGEAIRAFTRQGLHMEARRLRQFCVQAFLLDTADPVLRGGTGKTFDWKLARRIAKYGPVILAGGLTPQNVAQAIREVRPFAVDVATGVESSPGIKDPAKLRDFFAAVQAADRIESLSR